VPHVGHRFPITAHDGPSRHPRRLLCVASRGRYGSMARPLLTPRSSAAVAAPRLAFTAGDASTAWPAATCSARIWRPLGAPELNECPGGAAQTRFSRNAGGSRAATRCPCGSGCRAGRRAAADAGLGVLHANSHGPAGPGPNVKSRSSS
jgi:hypothetical protein